MRRSGQGDADTTHVIESPQRPDQCGPTDHHRAGAQLIQAGGAVAFDHYQQFLQVLSLLIGHATTQSEPEAFFNPAAQLGDKSLQYRYARQ